MQNIKQQQIEMHEYAEHYEESCDFFGLCGQDEFDEEVETDGRWQGLVRDEQGVLQVFGEFVYDRDDDGVLLDSGWGWYL